MGEHTPDRTNGSRIDSSAKILSIIAIVLASISLLLTGYIFWYQDVRTKNEAHISIVEFIASPQSVDGVAAFQIVLSNAGTTPVAVSRIDWILSEANPPINKQAKKMRWVFSPELPIVVPPDEIIPIMGTIPRRAEGKNDLRATVDFFFDGLPDYIREHPNILIQLHSTLVVNCLDVKGDFRRVSLDLGEFYVGGGGHIGENLTLLAHRVRSFDTRDENSLMHYGYSLTPFPVRMNIFSTSPVMDPLDFYSAARPAFYNVGPPISPAALISLSPNAQAVVDSFAATLDGQ